MQGPENSLPLSPQWLLPKSGDSNKARIPQLENNPKKRDVYRPAFLDDVESGGRDRWRRDEERDANPSIRKDRWRGGEREMGDSQKNERWSDSSSTVRRGAAAAADRWAVPSMDKWSDLNKLGGDAPVPQPHDRGWNRGGKEEREGEHRPWRPSCLRKPPNHHNQMTSKEGAVAPASASASASFGHGHGRGRAESARAGSSAVGCKSDVGRGDGDDAHREPCAFSYSRTKLLDIYRSTDTLSVNKLFDGLAQIPSLTQGEPLEPLALCAPSAQETAILKGIHVGEIVSSGVPQMFKDGSNVRTSSSDFPQSRRANNNHGVSAGVSDEGGKDEAVALKKNDEDYNNRDGRIKGSPYTQSQAPWDSSPVGKHALPPSPDRFDFPTDVRSRISDIGWSQVVKDSGTEWENGLPNLSFSPSELKWQKNVEESVVANLPSAVVRKLLHPSPEDLLLYYKDPQDRVQGPFSGSDIIGWFDAGYFGIDLPVRLASAPNDAPFSLLGDVMPHLRAKARPPPGFATSKQIEVTEVSNRLGLGGSGKVIPCLNGVDVIKKDHRGICGGSSIEAENRFLESLMYNDIRNSAVERFAEGLQGSEGHSSSGMASVSAESRDAINPLAQKTNVEWQKTFAQPYPCWPARDAFHVPIIDMLRGSTLQQEDLSSVTDVRRQSHAHNLDLVSDVQGLSDIQGIKNGVGSWQKFSAEEGSGQLEGRSDLHRRHNLAQDPPCGLQQNLQPQNQSSVLDLPVHTLGSPSVSDKLFSSGTAHGPQLLNLLQQQYLLELQSQQSSPTPQFSLVDKILLLKQQQKKEEEQHLLQQRQQLRSQIMSEEHLIQGFGGQSYGQLMASAMPASNAPLDKFVPQLPLQFSSQIPTAVIDGRTVNSVNVGLKEDSSRTIASEGCSLHLPHQILGLQKTWPSSGAHTDNVKQSDLPLGSNVIGDLQTTSVLEYSTSSEGSAFSSVQKASESVEPASATSSETNVVSVPSQLPEPALSQSLASDLENEIVMREGTNDIKGTPGSTVAKTPVKGYKEEVSTKKNTENVEPHNVKKASDKKSRKLKSSKALSSPVQSSISPTLKSSESGRIIDADKSGLPVAIEETREASGSQEMNCIAEGVNDGYFKSVDATGELKSDAVLQNSTLINPAHKAWKSAVCVKAKSLIEIQQEEKLKEHTEIPVPAISASSSSVSLSAPWAGVVAQAEPNISRDINPDGTNCESYLGKSEPSENKKSGLHDVLADEVLAKSKERCIDSIDCPPISNMSVQSDTLDDENFIEAKDTKKSRKKAAKAKLASAKLPASISSSDTVVASSPVEKGKSYKHVQVEKEAFPTPSGPLLGDFVRWKGESASPAPAPAWSNDSGKIHKPTSLRDILREQEKKFTSVQPQAQIFTQKSQPSTHAGSWSVSISSPPKAALSTQGSSHTLSQPKYKGEDDLFWGPPDQPKHETKQPDFPQLGNHGNQPVKNASGKRDLGSGHGRHKPAVGKGVMPVSSPHASGLQSIKGKRDSNTKHSEAMAFREWCENESVRLTGSKDTSFLEYCLKLSRSEAEILLRENLGSSDPNHEFIDSFLNYMELLPADVLEIAFQSLNDVKASNRGGATAIAITSSDAEFRDFSIDSGGGASVDGSSKGGKKKGKKGKKVSPSVLGFNVVSNRIMMGEIQTVED